GDRWHGERLVLEADEIAGVVAAHELDHPETGERDRAVAAALLGPQIDARGRSLERDHRHVIPRHMERLEGIQPFGDDRAPACTFGRVKIDARHAVVRRLEIRAEPDRIVTWESLAESLLPLGDDAQTALRRLTIEQIQVAPCPSLEGVEQDPPSVWRRARPDDVLLRTALTEDGLVAGRVVAKSMEPHPAVVVLVTGGDRSRSRVRGVVETVAGPRHGRTLRMRNALRELATGRDLDHVQRGHLIAAARQSVGDVARVGRWKV